MSTEGLPEGLFVIGLTGSIGMGKSTTAGIFAAAGLPVWDADAAVHRIYQKSGAAVKPMRDLCPAAVVEDAVSREQLKIWIAKEPGAVKQLEDLVHPLVAKDRALFFKSARAEGHKMVVVDIPLLFETGAESWLDCTIVVTAPAEVQKQRVLARPGMDTAHFNRILALQMPDAEKRAKADYILHTTSLDRAEKAVHQILEQLKARMDADA